ncbi:FecR family protein [Zhouia amylolytica]|uniref:FecR family protein n=1 Tax=Zhouia amylolytica TaxID=376730 RepID=UPI0020CD60A9|nr:FecR family protein [Zhouia amylolytica]MCQ0111129.1 FecR family protein [Zhouia amylolytica]
MNKEHLLAKWLSGEITPDELQALKQLEDLSVYEKIIAKTALFQSPLYNEDVQLESLKMKTCLTNKQPKIKKIKPWKAIAGIAATIAVILTTVLFFNESNTVVIAEKGKKETFNLPDHSIVKLNASSKAEYSKKQWNKRRALKLDGEAFFEVAHGEKFDVITKDGIVSVVGTQFNVKNRENFYEIKCFEGIVRVQYNDLTKLITKGKSFLVINGIVTENEDHLLSNQPDWLQNRSKFSSIPYQMVLKEFERIFDVTISANNVDLNYHFTGEFNHNDINKALKTITLPLQLQYKLKDDKTVVIYAD